MCQIQEKNKLLNINNYYMGLDIYRIIGCLCIVLYHYLGAQGDFVCKDNFFGYVILKGNSFLDFFFMVSGFCMAVNYKEKIRGDSISFKQYFFKHYIVFVCYAVITIPVALIKQLLVYKTGADVFPVGYKILFDILCVRTGYGSSEQPYNSPLWFINILIQVYIVYYLFNKKISYKNSLVGSVVIILLGLSIYNNSQVFPNAYVVAQALMNFFIGVLIYEVYTNNKVSKKGFIILSFIFVVLSVALSFIDYKYISINVVNNYRLFNSFMFWPGLIWLGLYISTSKNGLKKYMIKMSGLSTSVFIWHHPLIYIIRELNSLGFSPFRLNEIRTKMLYFFVLIGVAVLSHFCIEKKVKSLISNLFGIASVK